MIIGIPKEIKNNENRVALTPAGAKELVKRGHTVYVQHTAGINSGFADDAYVAAGARILPAIEDVYGIAEMIDPPRYPCPEIRCFLHFVHSTLRYNPQTAARADQDGAGKCAPLWNEAMERYPDPSAHRGKTTDIRQKFRLSIHHSI